MSSEELSKVSEQDIKEVCQNENEDKTTTFADSKVINFKEPISISSLGDKKQYFDNDKFSSGATSIICCSSDFNELNLSHESEFSSSCQGSSLPEKETGTKNICVECPPISVDSISNCTDNMHTDLTNVEEWLKLKSDSLSSLEFDSEIKPSEIDVTDFLNLKSIPSSNSLLDINSKLVHDIGLGQYAGVRPVTPSGLSNSSDNEGLLYGSVNDYVRSKFQIPIKKSELAHLQVDKGLFEEMLLMEKPSAKKNMGIKSKEANLGLDDKGLFEELLLPGVQEWLLSVSTMDKKDSSSSTPVDSMSVPPSPNDCSTSVTNDQVVDSCSSSKENFDDYDIIGRNINSLRLLTTQEIENLQSRTLELDESQLKSDYIEDETAKQLTDLPPIVTNDTENKLFSILTMDVSPDIPEASANLNVSNLHVTDISSLNKLVISPDQFINNDDKLHKSMEQNKVAKSLEVIPNNSSEIACRKSSFFLDASSFNVPLSLDSYSKSADLITETKVVPSISNTENFDKFKANFKILLRQQDRTNSSGIESISQKIVTDAVKQKQFSKSKFSKILNLPVGCLSPLKKLNDEALQPDHSGCDQARSGIKSSPRAGIAKVNITVNSKSYTTNVSVISSNKEQTLFKINTSDIVHAISSIKESFLEPLGLKSSQLIETANTANKLLDLSVKKNKKNSAPLNFEINQYIQEVRAPILKSKSPLRLNEHFNESAASDKELKMPTVKASNKKLEIKQKYIIMKTKPAKLRTLGENVGISLLPGAPPTMVSIPSVLDSLSGPTTSKINLAEVLAKCEEEEKQKQNAKGEDTIQVSDEKTNCALLQLGFDPYSIVPEINSDGAKKWLCPISSCSKHYPKLSYLKVHILTHKGIRPYKCSYESCDWSFYTSYKLKRHLETHLKRRDFVCKELDCNRRFTTIYNLNTHMALHKRPKTWACSLPSCKSSYHTRRKLEVHMRNHTDANPPYKCTVEGCSKAYFTPNSLASHTRSHHKEEDIQCQWDGCGKKFDKPCRLKAHMKAHTGQRPYVCTFEGCNWRFHCASKLSRHQRKHTNDRKYSCPICKKAFLRSEHLKGHILTHTGVRNFQCPMKYCDAKFTAKSSLYVHLKKHKNAGMKFPCPIETCKEVHGSKFNLHHHLLNSHSSLLDINNLSYGSTVNGKEVIGAIPELILPTKSQFPITNDQLSLQNATIDTSSMDNSCVIGIEIPDRNNCTNRPDCHESNLVPLLALSSEDGLVASHQDSNMPILVADNLLPFNDMESSQASSEFVFSERDLNYKTTKGLSFENGSSARTDVLGNLILSQRAKRRQQINLARKITATSDARKVSFCNDLTLSSSVGDTLSAHFQPILLQDDAMSTSIYHDLLSDSINDAQSTINLRDLE